MSYNAPMRDFFDAQFPNLFLWAPLILALGAAAYFAGPTEPQVAYPGLIAALAGLILVVRRPRAWLAGPMLLIFGFCYAMAFTHMMGTPTIPRDLRDVTITGTITRVDHTPDKTRVHIRIPADQINPKLSPATSARVRINIDGDAHVGDHIQATAALFRPSAANAPETFDYARWAYFNGLAATGYATRYTITPGTGNGGIHRLRDRMHDAAGSFLTDALVLGDGAALPRDARAIWTAAGVGHVWSISGFHMTLVGGWLFALFYGIFRLIPGITRRIPARIPALMAAWGGLTFYLFLSGAGVATLRAYLMTTLGFMAVALGRRAINLRNVCLAFALIILINPYYVMQPGFQLSFAAIFGLVWYFGDAAPYQRRTRIERVRRAIGATVLTSVIATLFTAPFVAAHFYAMPTYGLVGNLILLPIFSFLLMPLVLTGTLTATLWGWTGPITWAGGIYEWGLAIAGRIASLPGAVILMPHIPNVAMVLMILGLAGIIFIRPAPDAKQAHQYINYILGGILIAAGITITALTPRPVLYATHDHELIGVRGPRDTLEFNKSRASNHFFAFDTWKQINREPIGTPNARRSCPGGLCQIETPKWRAVYVQKFVPTMQHIGALCRDPSVDYIVTYFRVTAPACAHKILRGGFVITPDGRVRMTPARRHWHNPRP